MKTKLVFTNLPAAFAAVLTLTAAAHAVEIQSFSSDMLASTMRETTIELCGFENGAAGWSAAGAETIGPDFDDPRSGNACLLIVKSPAAQRVELMRRFLFHENFKMVALHVWIWPNEKPPQLEAVVRDEKGVLKTLKMERNDDPNEEFDELLAQVDGAWMRFALTAADALPRPSDEPFHPWLRNLTPDPVYIEAIRVTPANKAGEVMVDDMVAVLSDKTVAQPLYLTAELDDSGDKPAVEARIYNVGKPGAQRKASPLRLAVEARDVDAPLWDARAKGLAAVPEPAAGAAGAVPISSARVELDGPLPPGGCMIYARLQEETQDKDKTTHPTRHTATMFLAHGAEEAERTLEDFSAAGSTDNWLLELDRRNDEDTRLARARAGGRVSLDAGITETDGKGGKSLGITTKSGRANEVLCVPIQLSAAVKKAILRFKTVKGGPGRELVMHVAGRNGDITEYAVALGNPGADWKEMAVALGAGHDNAPLSILGFALRGGEAEILLDEVREAAVSSKGAFHAAFSADAPRVMLGVHKFPDMFRTIEARFFNPIPDCWRGNEVYFEAPTGAGIDVHVSAQGVAGELTYRVLGSGTNALAAGALKLDADGKGKVTFTPECGGLYLLEVSDGKNTAHCRLYAVASRGEEEEMLAAIKAFAGGPLARAPEYAEAAKSETFGSVREFAEKRRSPGTDEKKNDAELKDDAIWFIRSPLTPAVVIDAPAGDMRYFADQDLTGMGGPTHFAYQAGNAVKVIKSDAQENLGGMTGNWMLAWFNGAEGWDKITRPVIPWVNMIVDKEPMHLDFPHLILFGKKPAAARLAGKDGLAVKLAERTTTLCVPLYGGWKRYAEHTKDWGAGLPKEVVSQCERWEKRLAYVPVDVREYYAIDAESGDVLIKDVYDFLKFKPAAAPGDVAAPAPPTSVLAADSGAPVVFDDALEDMNATTMMGPYRVIPGKSECGYRFKDILKYVHEIEFARPGEPLDDRDWRAASRYGWLGSGLFVEFMPGDQNYYAYERAGRVIRTFPYFGEDKADLRERARRYLYRVGRDYFLEPSCFTGPGPGGNGRAINTSRAGGYWGDRLKHTTASLYNVWQFAYYAGMWQMTADRWDLVRRMNSADHSWLIPGPTSWCEHYHHGAGPGSIAAARMALVVGDMREYARNVFLAAKIWIGETAWIQGAAPFAREHSPWNQAYDKDAIPVGFYGTTGYGFSGINENFVSPIGGNAADGIHENFWVWGTEELIRFWRDYLKPGTRHILDACDNRAHPGWEDLPPAPDDKPTAYASYWSLLKMKLLVMEQPEKDRAEYLRKRAYYAQWIGPDGSTSFAHVLAALRNGYEYRRVLPQPGIEPRFIETEIPFGGSGWIDGGGRPGRYSPEVKGIGLWNAAFKPPKPIQSNWNVIQGSIFSGFHRAWTRDADIETASISCGSPEIFVWRATGAR